MQPGRTVCFELSSIHGQDVVRNSVDSCVFRVPNAWNKRCLSAATWVMIVLCPPCLLACLPAYLPACLPVWLLGCLLTYLLACLLACLSSAFWLTALFFFPLLFYNGHLAPTRTGWLLKFKQRTHNINYYMSFLQIVLIEQSKNSNNADNYIS